MHTVTKLPMVQRWKRVAPRLKSLAATPWFYPVVLLLVGLAAYAYQIGALGFYWDDWEVVFLLNARDPALLHGYFAFDRPFAWPYQAMYALFGLNSIAWHLVTLLLRWAGIVLFYLSLRQIWPQLDGSLRWLGALLLVYPGFFQQSTSAAYNRHFTAFFLFMLSIYLMVLAVRQPKRAWWLLPLSWIAAFLQIFTIEYFAGLELVRPLILWLLYRHGGEAERRQALRRTLVAWLPFVMLFGLYLWWRLELFPATIPTREYAGDFKMLADFSGSLAGGVLALLTRFFLDLIYSVGQVWLAGFTTQEGLTLQSKAAWFALALGFCRQRAAGVADEQAAQRRRTLGRPLRAGDDVRRGADGAGCDLVAGAGLAAEAGAGDPAGILGGDAGAAGQSIPPGLGGAARLLLAAGVAGTGITAGHGDHLVRAAFGERAGI